MENPNILPSNRATLAAVIDPDATGASTVTTDWVSMSDFDTLQAIVLAGQLGTNATINAKLEQASDGTGTGAKDITGKAIAELSQAGSDDSDTQAIINCQAADLDVNGAFTHVRLSITVGTAASDVGAVVLGHNARYQPAADAASVAEVVS